MSIQKKYINCTTSTNMFGLHIEELSIQLSVLDDSLLKRLFCGISYAIQHKDMTT